MKKIVAVFDFDGTLTQDDTFIKFVRFTRGDLRFISGLFLNSHYLFLYFLRIYPNGKMKQRLFSYYFKGEKLETFQKLGEDFARHIKANSEQVKKLKELQRAGAKVYVITASVEEWVKPFCDTLGSVTVIGTKIESRDGFLTGCFSTKNCFGEQKVKRLLEAEPNRSEYFLYAYGDSRGDDEMLAFADMGTKVS